MFPFQFVFNRCKKIYGSEGSEFLRTRWSLVRSQVAWDATLVDLACDSCISPNFRTTCGSFRVDSQKMAYDSRSKRGECHLVSNFFIFPHGSSLIPCQDAEFSGQVGSLVVWPQHILSFWKKRPTAFSGAVADVVGGGESGRTHGSKPYRLGHQTELIGKSRRSNFQFFQNHFVTGFEFCHSHFESFFSNGSSKKKPDIGSLCRSGAL